MTVSTRSSKLNSRFLKPISVLAHLLVLPMLFIAVKSHQYWEGKKTTKCPNNSTWDCMSPSKPFLSCHRILRSIAWWDKKGRIPETQTESVKTQKFESRFSRKQHYFIVTTRKDFKKRFISPKKKNDNNNHPPLQWKHQLTSLTI